MSNTWDGEARGCADVMFSRIQILMRKQKKFSNTIETNILKQMNLDACIRALCLHCESNKVRLTDILEKTYLTLKENENEISR